MNASLNLSQIGGNRISSHSAFTTTPINFIHRMESDKSPNWNPQGSQVEIFDRDTYHNGPLTRNVEKLLDVPEDSDLLFSSNGENFISEGDGDSVEETLLSARIHVPVVEYGKSRLIQIRQSSCYLIYSTVTCLACICLFVWNLLRAYQHSWDVPTWRNHRWEEVCEVVLGVVIILEILATFTLAGWKEVCNDWELIFDAVVLVLTSLTLIFGLCHIISGGETFEMNLPLIIIRMIMQPIRLVYSCFGVRLAQGLNETNDIQMPEHDFEEFTVPRGTSKELPVF